MRALWTAQARVLAPTTSCTSSAVLCSTMLVSGSAFSDVTLSAGRTELKATV